MDEFFAEQFHGDGDSFWFKYEAVPVKQSAFVPYENRPRIEFESRNANDGPNSQNTNKKMMEFLRRIWSATMEDRVPNSERCHRHKINERMRREKEKQHYLALHSMLPPGTKVTKNVIKFIYIANKQNQRLTLSFLNIYIYYL